MWMLDMGQRLKIILFRIFSLPSRLENLIFSSVFSRSTQVPTLPVKIELENGDEIECELLVGADGGQSLVRKSLGRDKDMLAWQYHQMGLVATLQVSCDEANVTAWQRFLPSGPIALLPLGPTSSSLVWTVPKSELQGLLSLGDEVKIFT